MSQRTNEKKKLKKRKKRRIRASIARRNEVITIRWLLTQKIAFYINNSKHQIVIPFCLHKCEKKKKMNTFVQPIEKCFIQIDGYTLMIMMIQKIDIKTLVLARILTMTINNSKKNIRIMDYNLDQYTPYMYFHGSMQQ